MYNNYMREFFETVREFAKDEESETTFRVEKVYSGGKKMCDAYRFIMDDFLSETLNKAKDEMTDADFTWLCSQLIARVAEYLHR